MRKINWELVLGASGLVTAIAALFLSIWQAQISIKHNHITVEPRLHFAFSVDSDKNQTGWYVTNAGLGTAFIQDFILYLDGKPLSDKRFGGFLDLFNRLYVDPRCFVIQWPAKGTAIEVNNSYGLFKIKDKVDDLNCDEAKNEMFKNLSRIKGKIVYESIYHDKFEIVDAPYFVEKTLESDAKIQLPSSGGG